MRPFRRPDPGTDPMWNVASATPVFVAGEEDVDRLVQEHDLMPSRGRVDGLLVAQRHPTGWFLHAVRRDTLPLDQVALFAELVTMRAYLLLRLGPQAPAWEPAPEEGTWLSPAWPPEKEELTALDDALALPEGPLEG
jgi:hypothetical protein